MSNFNIIRLIKFLVLQINPEYLELRVSLFLSLLGFFMFATLWNSTQRMEHSDTYSWGKTVQRIFEDRLYISLGLIIVVVLAKLTTLTIDIHFNIRPYVWWCKYRMHRRRLKYANFLFRRLVAQVEGALWLMQDEENGTNQELMHQEMDPLEILRTAVESFRYDVDRVLYHWEISGQPLPTPEIYQIPADMEAMLKKSGYETINVKVNDEFLRSLAYP